MSATGRQAAQGQQAAWTRGRRRAAALPSCPPARRQPLRRGCVAPPTQALFQSILKDLPMFGGSSKEDSSSGLVERPLYRPQEMQQMGPFKVSPMGFGTWSWVRRRCWPLLPPLAVLLTELESTAGFPGLPVCPPHSPHPARPATTAARSAALQGNKLLWGYDESMDTELQVRQAGRPRCSRLDRRRGIAAACLPRLWALPAAVPLAPHQVHHARRWAAD